MTNKYQEKIEEVITQALTEKTFSLEIIEKIKSLKDGFESSQKTIELLTLSGESSGKTINELRTQNESLSSRVKSFEDRESNIRTKEKELEKNIYELEFQQKRANEIKELFGIVFKNPVMQKTAYNSHNKYENGFSNSGSSNSNETETING